MQLPAAFPIVDTHPDPTATTDLRLLNPWPELLALVKEKTAGLESMDHEQHGHVPYLLLLLHYLEEWKSSHNGEAPQNYKEKTAFRETVRKGEQTNNAEGGEENFEEAVGAVLKSLNPATPSSAVKEVFNSPECQTLTPKVGKHTSVLCTRLNVYDSLPSFGSSRTPSATSILLTAFYRYQDPSPT